LAITSSTKIEALSAFKEQPRLVIFSPPLHHYSREILASSPGSEFYTKQWDLEGRLDVPIHGVCPPDKLEAFVKRQLGLKDVSEVRMLYVGPGPANAQSNALAGGACGCFFVLVAVFAWIGVLLAARRKDNGGETA
jgi:hypothetical protein